MQIEVNEKEAQEIYHQRYLEQSKYAIKLVITLAVWLVVAILIAEFVYNTNEWLACALVILSSTPAFWVLYRYSKKASNYAKEQIKKTG